jgi:type IV pilus assembly protein PilX
MNKKIKGLNHRCGARREQGMIATLLAVIVLVATLLASVALMRSIDASNTIAGSLAFRQAVIQIADIAYQQSLAINFTEPTSDNTQSNIGYYATLQLPITTNNNGVPDVLVYQLMNPGTPNGTQPLSGLPSGYSGFYVVERLCPTVGPASTTTCIVPGATITGGSVSNQTKDNGPPFSSSTYAAFRLTAGVIGPKNTIGYVQTVLR